MNVINTNKNDILSWAPDMEPDALTQCINAAEHPCIDKPVVVCPDVHTGYGVTIGSVLAVTSALIPNAVGVDIGCSMSAAKTNILASDVNITTLEKIVNQIRQNIPVGTNHHKVKQTHALFDRDRWADCIVCFGEYESAQYQLGTMGGGNHFIELQEGDDGYLYYMIHSGSRNLGYKVGNYYNNVAEDLCTKWRHDRVVKDQLAFLPISTAEYNDYLKEMTLCLDFAKANHEKMQEILERILSSAIKNIEFENKWYTRHNYAAWEHHHGRDFIIHRKGAIRAREGEEQIIPGSQGTASYIVRGLGNPASYCSASHGSGRVLSRAKAKQTLDINKELEKMKGIVHNITSTEQLDEAPSAYKNIEDVIKQESDLVTPVIKLRPLAVVKG